MPKDETKKMIIRLVLTGAAVNGLCEIMEYAHVDIPQDMLKILVSNEAARIRELQLRYGSKRNGSRETEDTKQTTEEECAADILSKEESQIIETLIEIGFLEKNMQVSYLFRGGDTDGIPQNRGKRFLQRREWLGGDAKDEADIYEKGDELTNAVVAYLKENPSK